MKTAMTYKEYLALPRRSVFRRPHSGPATLIHQVCPECGKNSVVTYRVNHIDAYTSGYEDDAFVILVELGHRLTLYRCLVCRAWARL